jgi:hypothetical protein
VPEGAPSLRVLCARVGFQGGVSLGIFPLDESYNTVILSEVAAPQSEAAAQSKDPYPPETIREASCVLPVTRVERTLLSADPESYF